MYNSKVRIGARILSEKALNKLLPSNSNIELQINDTRERAFLYNSTRKKNCGIENSMEEKWDREFDRHFNNIFSILGGRGSGKTSVLLTLKYRITKKNNSDIILPLIVPEKMGETSDILGSIIGFLGDEVIKIKQKNKQYIYNETERFQSCRKINITVIEERYNELLKQYMYTKPDYREILINQYEGFSDYVCNAKNILDSEQKLIVKFEEFIEDFLYIRRELSNKISTDKNTKGQSNGKISAENEPLIFIFFDDVDLSTERCSEILNVILRYLSHPNINVFVTGNYKTFSEVLTINALQKDKILNEQMEKCFFSETVKDTETALEVRKTLTQDLLKKILPPAFRYNMPLMDERAKAEFVFSTEEDNYYDENRNEVNEKKEITKYYSMIELIIKNFIDSNYEKNDYSLNEYKNSFIYYKSKPLFAYFKIFDNTQRGTMNAYYFLYSLLNSDVSTEELRCLRIKRLLSTLIQSSSVLNKYENEINRIIDIRENFENTFVDYKYIESMLQEKQNENLVDDIITIFMLANFIENIVALENRKIYENSRRKVHGADVLCKILNSQNKEFCLYPNTKDLSMLLQMYTLINMRITGSNIKYLSYDNEKNYFLSKYFDVIDEVMGKNGLFETFSKLYFEDGIWVSKKIEMIMYYGGNQMIVKLQNVKELYKQIKDMRIDEKTLDRIRNKLESIIEEYKQMSENDFEESIMLEGSKVDNLTNVKKNHKDYIPKLEKSIQCYKDKMLFYKNIYKNSIPKYRITEEIKNKYKEVIDITSTQDKNSILLGFEKYFYQDYIYEDDYEKLLNRLKSFARRSMRYYSSVDEDKINEFYILFAIMGKHISKLEWIDSELAVDENEFIQDCISYIEVKSLYEITLRKIDSVTYKDKENFYKKFERLKKELMNWEKTNNYRGFIEYIKEKERESRQVDLND